MFAYLVICFSFLVSWTFGETTSPNPLEDPPWLPDGDQCGEGEFLCAVELRCIGEDLVCDGIQDCQDASDETSDLCLRRPCSPPRDYMGEMHGLVAILEHSSFRCSYGACIASVFTCNGIKDCRDGSDEKEEICKLHKCRPNKFQCDYGGCIHRVLRCNGRIDCFDGSDETQKLCSKIRPRCRNNYFQCNYGACIFGEKKCNGRLDCADGSDETPQLCSKQIQGGGRNNTGLFGTSHLPHPPIKLSPPTHPIHTVETPISSIPMVTKGVSATTVRAFSRPTLKTPTMTRRTPSIIFPPVLSSTHPPKPTKNPCPESECPCPHPLQFCVSCSPGTDVNHACEIIARERRLCSKETSEKVHLQVISCGYFDQIERVNKTLLRSRNIGACGTKTGVPPTTLALVDCWRKSSELLRCEQDGRWYPESPRRQPAMEKLCQTSQLNSDACGQLTSTRRNSRRFSWPFLVSLLDFGEFLCYGTLVERQWVLTTASCVDGFQEEWINTGNLHLVVQLSDGKAKMDISAIHCHPLYRAESRYRSDLCLLKLKKPVTQVEKLIPACLKQTQHDINEVLAVTLMAESDKSSKWKMVAQTLDKSCFEPHDNCSRELNPNQQFCGKPLNPNALHSGTSGSPYLVNSGTEREEKWTLAGVFSHFLQKPGCSSRQVFVSISKHFGWIQDCVERNQCLFRA